MRASQEGHTEISKLLIANGADVNRKNYEGMNALMLASQRGHANMVMLLINAPCAMDEQTQQGSTALMLACKRGHSECVKVLVGMGAEIYIKDNRGRTARDTATRRNHMELLQWLDTPAQIQLHREILRKERYELVMEIKQAFETGNLQFHIDERNTLNLLIAFERREKSHHPSSTGHNSDLEATSILSSDVLQEKLMHNQAYHVYKVEHQYQGGDPLLNLPLPPHAWFQYAKTIPPPPEGMTYTRHQEFFDRFIDQHLAIPSLPPHMVQSSCGVDETVSPITPFPQIQPQPASADWSSRKANVPLPPLVSAASTWDLPEVPGSRQHPFVTAILNHSPDRQVRQWEWSLLFVKYVPPSPLYNT